MKIENFLRKHIAEISICFFAVVFSSWLMFSTFSYENGSMLIATKAWSDFASQIPLIRSFSFGSNFPVQFPLFAGPPIHYHFLFYFFVGMFEKIGIRIDYAFNILSIIGFTTLIMMIYFFAKKIFKSTAVGILSILFFLFNGSLSFIYFLIESGKGDIISSIIQNTKFPSFGPYDGRLISAFWNLNIYTNQRHLALSLALSLLIIYIFISPIFNKGRLKKLTSLILGIVLGLSFFLHFAVFLMTIVAIMLLSTLFPKIKISGLIILLSTAVVSFPQYFYLGGTEGSFKPFFSPNYLINGPLNFFSFFYYWFANLGLHFIFIPLGFIFAPKNAKKIFIVFLSFFIIGHLIQFSPEAAANHKFFNYFLIIGNMFSAFAIVFLWKRKVFLRPVLSIFVFLLIFSGIIDFFPIYNDRKITLTDYSVNKDVAWIMKNTNPNSVFLNSQFLYDPASLAGRKIFLGWPYFAWSAGYDTNQRGKALAEIFNINNKKGVCALLKKNYIDYLEINTKNYDPNYPTSSGFVLNNFHNSYSSSDSFFIYDVKRNCD